MPALLEPGSRRYICRSCFLRSVRPTVQPCASRPAVSRHASKDSSGSSGSPDSESPVVRYFNEERPGRYRQLRDNDEFNRAVNGLDADVESTIHELEKKLQDTAKLIQLMEKYGMKDKAYELRRTYMSRPAIHAHLPDIPEDAWPRSRAFHVGRLNTYLRNAADDLAKGKITPKIVSSTWKYYSAARKALSTAWSRVPRDVWDFLWRVLAYDRDWNTARMAHVHVLAKDMAAAGLPPEGARQLLAIEAMFVSGWPKEAIDNWKKAAASLGSEPDTFQEYWELGVRMCAHAGDLERAERAVDTLFSSPSSSSPCILVPLIRAYAQTDPDKAWTLYRRLRDLLGASMKIEDYDEVIATFLATNHTELGLQAFVDMMFSADVDVRGKAQLPLVVGNHFFLGKWLKRLIGAGDLDGAFRVIRYMEGRGIPGSAIQVNGLVGAWLRTETADNVARAEDLAWAMVRARLVFVDLRRREGKLEWPVRLAPVSSPGDPFRDPSRDPSGDSPPPLRLVPRATLETFCLLAENYRSRGLHREMEALWDAFGRAELATNSFMMNQVIESYVQHGQAAQAVDFYRSVSRQHHICPDAHTFLALYRSLSVNRLVARFSDLAEHDVAMARRFFCDLVEAPWKLDEGSDQLPRSILHSFLKLDDYAGMLVACRALRELLGFAPSEALLIELAAGTTALRLPTKRNTKLLLDASRTTEFLLEGRRAALEKEGRSLENMTPAQKAAELCTVLEKLVLFKAKAEEEDLRALYEEAAREMGVYDVVVERDAQVVARLRKV